MKTLQFFFCMLLTLCRYHGILGVTDSPCTDDTIRLTQTATIKSPDNNVGRVEFCKYQEWGTITLESKDEQFWSQKNVQVACRQLGFSGGLNSIPAINISVADKSPSNLAIHFGEIICKGEEPSLERCTKKNIFETGSDVAPLRHRNDVFIVCRPTNISYSDLHLAGEHLGDVRLFGDVKDGVGAVEIYTERGWTGICPDSSWTGLDAFSICTALGYDFGARKTFGVNGANVQRSVYDARCESDSRDVNTSSPRVDAGICSFQAIKSQNDCTAPLNSFAGVECGTAFGTIVRDFIRLFMIHEADPGRAVGVVEVFLENRWGVVCGDYSKSLSKVTAEILCASFSFGREDSNSVHIASPLLMSYESNLKPLWVNKIICPSNATNIAECAYQNPLGFGNCSSKHILAIDCGSTVLLSDGNSASIIIGSIVLVFFFSMVFFIFGRVVWSMIRTRERVDPGFLSETEGTTATIATGENFIVDSSGDRKLFEVKLNDQQQRSIGNYHDGKQDKV